MCEREPIPAGDTVNRNVFAPHMYKENKFVIHGLFPFQSELGRKESVIWRKYAPLIDRVHELGCEKERNDNADRPASKAISYIGTLEAIVGPIRGIRTERGHGFTVYHEPGGGRHHAHVSVHTANGTTIRKSDLSDLRDELINVFGPLINYSC